MRKVLSIGALAAASFFTALQQPAMGQPVVVTRHHPRYYHHRYYRHGYWYRGHYHRGYYYWR
jgi:hypothetical protein